MNKEIMNTSQNEVLRKEILDLCRQTAPYGAGIPVLKAALRKIGYEVAEQELLLHVSYLEGKGLIKKEEVKNRTLNIDRQILFITPEGIDYLEGNRPDTVGVY